MPEKIVNFIALAAAIYHLSTAVLGAPTALIHRPISLIFLLTILYLTYDYNGKKNKIEFNWLNIFNAIILLLILIYTFSNYGWFESRFIFVEPLKRSKKSE